MTAQPHEMLDVHGTYGLDGPSSPDQAKWVAASKVRASGSGTETPPGEAMVMSEPTAHTPRPADALLLIYADALDDLEHTRIATGNRIRALIDLGGDGSPEVARLEALADGLKALEHGVELELKRAMRKHPLGPWVKATVGIGEKQAARLLAAIGDPADRPNPAKLWAYCGLHVVPSGHRPPDDQISGAAGAPVHPRDQVARDAQSVAVPGVAPSRRRGQRANWSTTAKTRAYLVAESCIKQAASPYRAVYDQGRAKYAEAVHVHPCARCGPAGKPAQPGTPLSAGHQHARAMRLVMKAILLDLWREARRLQEIE